VIVSDISGGGGGGGGGVEFRLRKIEIAVSGRVFYAPPWNFALNVRATSGGRES